MKLLLAGGTGFIGKSIIDSYVKKKLTKFKIKKIYIISRSGNKFIKQYKNIEFIKANLSKVKKLPDIDIAIYLAESTSLDEYKNIKKISKLHKNSIDNFCNLFKPNKNTKVLYCSSGSVYKPSKNKVNENSQLIKKKDKRNYKYNYSSLKLYSENKIRTLAKNGVKCSIARCFSFVGPNLPLTKHYAIGNFLYVGLFKKLINVKSRKKVIRSYMFADDLSLWLLTIAKNSSFNSPTYNVGSDTSVNIKKLAQIIGTMFNKQVKINKYSNKDVDCYVPNINKAKKKLKLKINYDLKESINLTINNNYEKVN